MQPLTLYEFILFTTTTYGCLHVERINYSLSLLSHLSLTLTLPPVLLHWRTDLGGGREQGSPGPSPNQNPNFNPNPPALRNRGVRIRIRVMALRVRGRFVARIRVRVSRCV